MGGMLSKSFNFNSKKSQNDQTNSSTHKAEAIPIIELVKPECLKTNKKIIKKKKSQQIYNPQDGTEVIVRKKLTLEELLLASPGSKFKPNQNNGSGELYVFKHFSKRVHPSSSSSADAASSKARRVKIGDEVLAYKKDMDTTHTTTCTSMMDVRSAKVKKRVSFKLPEEADIYTYYYSSEEKLDNYYCV